MPKRTFKGGYKFPEFEGEPQSKITPFFSENKSIRPLPIVPSDIEIILKKIIKLPDQENVKTIVINAVDAEPLNLKFDAFLNHRPNLILELQSVLSMVYKNASLIFAGSKLNHPLPENIAHLELDPKYPQHHPEMIEQALFKKNLDDKVLILDRWQAHKIASSCFSDPSSNSVITALCGAGIINPQGWIVPVGTPLSLLLKRRVKDGEWTFVKNSMLNGCIIAPQTFVMDEDTHAIIAIEKPLKREFLGFLRPGRKRISFTKTFLSSWFPFKKAKINSQAHGELRNCIACNFCDDICPVRILPEQIYKRITHGLEDEARGLKPDLCIECGLCTFACPSKIDLMEAVKKAKR